MRFGWLEVLERLITRLDLSMWSASTLQMERQKSLWISQKFSLPANTTVFEFPPEFVGNAIALNEEFVFPLGFGAMTKSDIIPLGSIVASIDPQSKLHLSSASAFPDIGFPCDEMLIYETNAGDYSAVGAETWTDTDGFHPFVKHFFRFSSLNSSSIDYFLNVSLNCPDVGECQFEGAATLDRVNLIYYFVGIDNNMDNASFYAVDLKSHKSKSVIAPNLVHVWSLTWNPDDGLLYGVIPPDDSSAPHRRRSPFAFDYNRNIQRKRQSPYPKSSSSSDLPAPPADTLWVVAIDPSTGVYTVKANISFPDPSYWPAFPVAFDFANNKFVLLFEQPNIFCTLFYITSFDLTTGKLLTQSEVHLPDDQECAFTMFALDVMHHSK